MGNNKQQTAVEWFYRWFNDNQEATIKEGVEAFEQAKEMEKEQIVDAANAIDEYPAARPDRMTFGEQYYNETYGKANLEV